MPSPTTKPVSESEQTTSMGNLTVSQGSQDHTEIDTISGGARTSNCILSVVGAQNGNKIRLVLLLPATAGIILSVYSGSVTGSPVISTTTNGNNRSATFDLVYSVSQASWVPTLISIPSVTA